MFVKLANSYCWVEYLSVMRCISGSCIALHNGLVRDMTSHKEIESIDGAIIHNEIIESIANIARKTITTVIVTMSLKRFSAV